MNDDALPTESVTLPGFRIGYLADRPEAVPLVVGWWHDEWGYRRPEVTLETKLANVRGDLSRDTLPIHLVALVDDAIVGAAALKPHEMLELYPDKTPWLGSVYVPPRWRGQGIASALALKIADLAAARGASAIHLQTFRLDGGLYARLGWQPVEQVRYLGEDVLVMAKMLNRPSLPKRHDA